MNNIEIDELLCSDRYSAPFFRGVFSSDKIPKTVQKPACFVANTSKAGESGMHWVAFFVTRTHAEFFDSYGLKPQKQEFLEFLQANAPTWFYNSKKLQGAISTTCGQYCVLYLMHRCRGVDFQTFLDHFSSLQLHLNDRTANDIVNDFFNTDLAVVDMDFIAEHL